MTQAEQVCKHLKSTGKWTKALCEVCKQARKCEARQAPGKEGNNVYSD